MNILICWNPALESEGGLMHAGIDGILVPPVPIVGFRVQD